jgi:hypothetical protein
MRSGKTPQKTGDFSTLKLPEICGNLSGPDTEIIGDIDAQGCKRLRIA